MVSPHKGGSDLPFDGRLFPLVTLVKHMGTRAAWVWALRTSAQQLLGTEHSYQAVGWKRLPPLRTVVTLNPEPWLMPSVRPERPAQGAVRLPGFECGGWLSNHRRGCTAAWLARAAATTSRAG